MTPETLLAVLAVAFVVAFFHGFIQQPPDRIAEAQARFIDLSRLPRAQALAELHERVEKLTARFPGKTYLWYVEWLVTDLERAKR